MDIFVPPKEPFEGGATQKQKQFIWELGFKDEEAIKELGKKQASIVIDQLRSTHLKSASGQRARKQFLWAGIFLFLMIPSCGVFLMKSGADAYGEYDKYGGFGILCFIVGMVLLLLAAISKAKS